MYTQSKQISRYEYFPNILNWLIFLIFSAKLNLYIFLFSKLLTDFLKAIDRLHDNGLFNHCPNTNTWKKSNLKGFSMVLFVSVMDNLLAQGAEVVNSNTNLSLTNTINLWS